jgi:K+-transporting ATPase ATPase C chain
VRRQLVPAIRAFLALTVICGLLYPLAVTGIGQLVFGRQANGSVVHDQKGGEIGSSLIGQSFDGAKWFHSRPSSAGDGYDPTASSPSNLGPSNPVLLKTVAKRVADYRKENAMAKGAPVPVDAVTGSGSGLDPQISVANAELQAPRVARERGLTVAQVQSFIRAHTDGLSIGFLGEKGVNVLALNSAVEQAAAR